MNNNIIVFFILIISLIIFFTFIKLFEFIPKRYHKNIQLMSSLGIVIVISGTFITYNKEKQDKIEKEKKEYVDNILKNFSDIDDFIMNNYKDYSLILDIFYNKIQIPSSDNDMNSLSKKMDKKTKDALFILYGKLSTLFEKMFVTNSKLFDNDKLGIKVRMYIENIFYYEYWTTTKNIFSTNFIDFMESKYKYLTLSDLRYYKPDRTIYRIPYIEDASFIIKSPKENGLWY
jgi:hypothetical protein